MGCRSQSAERGRWGWVMLVLAVLTLVIHQWGVAQSKVQERVDMFALALGIARSHDKPLLVVGRPTVARHYSCGDVTIDLDPAVLSDCPTGGQVADVRDLPFSNAYFGAAFASHVLEHLDNLEDVARAYAELSRVADHVIVASPSRQSIISQMMPDHHLWVDMVGIEQLSAEERGGARRKAIIRRDGTIIYRQTAQLGVECGQP